MSTSHSMPTSCHFIMLVRCSVAQIQSGKLPKLPQIETDSSWAMLQAACMSANNMDISQYLTSVYEGNDNNITTAHVCAAHILHPVA